MKLCGIISYKDFVLFTRIHIQFISVIHTLLLEYTVLIYTVAYLLGVLDMSHLLSGT